MKTGAVLVAGVLCVVWPGRAVSADFTSRPAPAPAIVAGIQARYERTHDLQADFSQLTSFQGFTALAMSRGRFAFKQPGRFRWDYTEPHQQQIIVNGETVLYYVPEHRQVIKTTLNREADTQAPIRLLAGASRLARDFEIRPLAGTPYRLRLAPKPRGGMRGGEREGAGEGQGAGAFEVEVDPATSYITAVTLRAANGATTMFRFTRLQPNRGLADALFSFAVPDGVELIELPQGSP